MADTIHIPVVSEIAASTPDRSADLSNEMGRSTSTASHSSPNNIDINSIMELPTDKSSQEQKHLTTSDDSALAPLSSSPALSPEPRLQLNRSASSTSSVSGQSTSSSRLSDSGFSVRKRGYMRPQATIFSESAKNRESVMSLGSIAHLQYYFARTGLLDGKGAQLARKNLQIKVPGSIPRSASLGLPNASLDPSLSPVSPLYAVSESGALIESPLDVAEDAQWDRELALLPPTVSTYNQRPAYVPPPPDLRSLRRELTESLEDALKVLKETNESDSNQEPTQGWYELQGLHLLDTTTLAIRAAKNYYTSHSQYQRLHSIKSEREIRSELYQVLEILKRMAARNFAGGLRQNEKVAMLTWIVGISELIQAEINEEKREAEERASWAWRTGDWSGRERERELAFIKSFIGNPGDVPEWTTPAFTLPETSDSDTSAGQPTSFLSYFASGLELVKLHNILVAKSSRPFEIIKTYHTDTIKPYRRAENLRYWNKAAELRWDIHLKIDAMGVATLGDGKDDKAREQIWRSFDDALLTWCTAVREELSREWSEPEARKSSSKLRSEDAAASSASVDEQKPVERGTSTVEEHSTGREEQTPVMGTVPMEQPVVADGLEIQEPGVIDDLTIPELSVQ